MTTTPLKSAMQVLNANVAHSKNTQNSFALRGGKDRGTVDPGGARDMNKSIGRMKVGKIKTFRDNINDRFKKYEKFNTKVLSYRSGSANPYGESLDDVKQEVKIDFNQLKLILSRADQRVTKSQQILANFGNPPKSSAVLDRLMKDLKALENEQRSLWQQVETSYKPPR